MYFSLSLVPVRIETLGEFSAPNPWNGNRQQTWTLNFYRLVSKTFAPHAKPERLRKSPNQGGDPASRRKLLQGSRFKRYETIGFDSGDGRLRMLPRMLLDLWQAGDVPDSALPAIFKQFEEKLSRSDFKPNRKRLLFNVEAVVLMVLGLAFASLWLADRAGSIPPLDGAFASFLGWAGLLLVVAPTAGLIIFGRKWHRRDAHLKEEFRAGLKQWNHQVV